MTTLQLILVSTSAVLLLGIAAISVLVGGRVSRPKNWKKQVEKIDGDGCGGGKISSWF